MNIQSFNLCKKSPQNFGSTILKSIGDQEVRSRQTDQKESELLSELERRFQWTDPAPMRMSHPPGNETQCGMFWSKGDSLVVDRDLLYFTKFINGQKVVYIIYPDEKEVPLPLKGRETTPANKKTIKRIQQKALAMSRRGEEFQIKLETQLDASPRAIKRWQKKLAKYCTIKRTQEILDKIASGLSWEGYCELVKSNVLKALAGK